MQQARKPQQREDAGCRLDETLGEASEGLGTQPTAMSPDQGRQHLLFLPREPVQGGVFCKVRSMAVMIFVGDR